MISYGRQSISANDIQKVVSVLSSKWLTQGPSVDNFEKAFAGYCGSKYAVAVSSGTAALHLACLAIGLKSGDEGITTPNTFAASANCMVYCGAKPVFSDIDSTGNLDPEQIFSKITSKTKVLIPVHYAGLPADMKRIHSLAQKHRLTVIEDACHALGAVSEGKRVGSCAHSAMCVFSFHPVKHITTGEGGMITTNSSVYYSRLKALRSHGVYRNAEWAETKGGWYYEMRDLGFNYRITDFQSALGESQLESLPGFLRARRKIAEYYHRNLSDLGMALELPALDYERKEHAWHLFAVRIKGAARLSRREVYDGLRAAGIFSQVHYIPVHRHPFYRKNYPGAGKSCRAAERFYKEVLSLPIYPGLTEPEQKKIVRTLRGLLA